MTYSLWSGKPIAFRARDGRRMFAFDPATDPIEVMVEFAWAWAKPDRQKVCDLEACPTLDDSYCLDCHNVAYAAAEYARQRLAELEPAA